MVAQNGVDTFFLHVENHCIVTDNYRCDEELDHSEYTELPIIKEMTLDSTSAEGVDSYSTEYVLNRDGVVTVSVVLARRGGLYAEYFNNAYCHGTPAWTKVENYMSFDWQTDLVSKEAADFVSIHWYGKLLAPTTEDFTFIFRGDDGFRFYFDTVLLIDRWDSCCDDMQVTLRLV